MFVKPVILGSSLIGQETVDTQHDITSKLYTFRPAGGNVKTRNASKELHFLTSQLTMLSKEHLLMARSLKLVGRSRSRH